MGVDSYLATSVVGSAESCEPRSASAHDGWYNGNGLHVCDGCGASEDTHICREWGFKAGFTGLA